ncbi:Do family serine endopeptidase [Mesorhizobium sp. M2C.T.Ca.TU.009.01.2.1]|nr:Do family serine endopeptidase [Mesorhizobium sp. M2C.T.Ca.TU.009.01.2.1]
MMAAQSSAGAAWNALRAVLVAVGVLSTVSAAWAAGPSLLVNDPPSLAPMLERVVPGVVSISVKGRMNGSADSALSDPFLRKFFGLPEQPSLAERSFQVAGSGVIVDSKDGYVLTNNHLLENADEIVVTLLDRRSFPAKVVGTDQPTDIAVLQIRAGNLMSVPLGDSGGLRVGDYVAAVGNPFGLSQTVTLGIVSALGRSGLGSEGLEDFIQTDASINPGNSGGALVNLRGEVVGINSALVGPAGGNVGIGFAIPINMAKQVMGELIAHGTIRRGELGILIQDLTPLLAQALKSKVTAGALVSEVIEGSSASTAGVLAGDVVVAVDGRPIHSATGLRTAIGALRVGEKTRLSIVRKNTSLELTVQLAEANTISTLLVKGTGLLSGVVLADISPESAAYGQTDGAEIVAVDPESSAAAAGLVAGDFIVSVGQQSVHSAMQVVQTAGWFDRLLLLGVFHAGGTQYVAIP